MRSKAIDLLSYAFRPFFLLNGLYAILAVFLWVIKLHGAGLPAISPLWHGHEMLIGFAMAAVAGFSLTAVANWTGRPAVKGVPLALLVSSWFAGRLAMLFTASLPHDMVFFLDMLFPVYFALLISREIIAGKSRRNYPLVAIMATVVMLNALYHLGANQWLPGYDRLAILLLIHTVLLLVTIITGRIVPVFTGNWLRKQGRNRLPVSNDWLNRLVLLLVVLVGLTASLIPAHPLTGIMALVTAFAHAVRLGGWRGFATTSNALLFVLHVAYAWLIFGYLMLAFATFGWFFSPTAALHALTMGAIGSTVLAVTTRVALGHTGRPLLASRLTVLAYWILSCAALLRVLGPLTGKNYMLIINLSAGGWILAFLLFTWVYWPILSRPREA